MLKALLHTVSPNLNECVLTHLKRTPIDIDLARKQHRAYRDFLKKHHIDVVELNENNELADSVFIEDTAIIFHEVAIIAQMGVASRRREIPPVEAQLIKDRRINKIQAPAIVEGGDVLQIGNKVFVGHSKRTNVAGINSLTTILSRFNYEVVPVSVKNALHLKTACTAVNNRTLLVNPHWVDLRQFAEFNVITIAEDEPWAANALRIGDTVCMHKGFPHTIQIMEDLGFKVETLDISEFIKAEAGLTCLSLLYDV